MIDCVCICLSTVGQTKVAYFKSNPCVDHISPNVTLINFMSLDCPTCEQHIEHSFLCLTYIYIYIYIYIYSYSYIIMCYLLLVTFQAMIFRLPWKLWCHLEGGKMEEFGLEAKRHLLGPEAEETLAHQYATAFHSVLHRNNTYFAQVSKSKLLMQHYLPCFAE